MLNEQANAGPNDSTAPTLTVSGATQSSTNQYYYIVQIPTNNTTNKVTVTAAGGAPVPVASNACVCVKDSYDPPTNGALQYSINVGLGTQDTNSGPKVTVNISSNTTAGEYTYQVTQVTQSYEACSNDFSGGPGTITNTLSSSNVTLLAYSLTSQTALNAPDGTTNTRTTVGIGEKVNISFLPASVNPSWGFTTTGVNSTQGTLKKGSSTATLTAGDQAESDTVTATVAGISNSVAFNVIEPTTITGTKIADTPISAGNAGIWVCT